MKKIYAVSIFLLIGLISFSQTTYTWNLAGGGSWATATNWTPTRATPATNDILVINNGGTKTISNIPLQTIGRLIIANNTNVTLTPAAAVTLTISNTGVGLDVQAGSTLNLFGGSGGAPGSKVLTLAFSGSGNSNSIAGTLVVDDASNPSVFNATNSVTTVTGTLRKNAGSITSSISSLLFNGTGTYIHSLDASSIPTATWATTSNCNITGVTGTAPSGLGQAFGNFTWDCAGHNSLVSLNSALTTVNGSFTVKYAGQYNAGSGRTQNGLSLSTNSNLIFNVAGNFNVDHYSTEATWLMLTNGSASVTVNVGGNFNLSRTGTGTCFFDYYVGTTLNNLVVNVTGNYIQTGGYLDWCFYPTSGSNFTTMNLAGNFSQTGTSTMITSTTDAGTPNGKIIFTKAGTQTITVSNPLNLTYTNFEVNGGSYLDVLSDINLTSNTNAVWGGKFIVNTGGTLDMNTYRLLSSSGSTAGSNNAFTLNAAAKVITANNNGLQNGTIGSVSTAIATRTYNSGADYEFQGLTTGTFITTPVAATTRDIIINNATGNVSLNQPLAVSRELALQSGIFITTAVNLITVNDNAIASGASNAPARFVSGPVRKIGNDAFTFPVGKLNYWYRYCGISAPANTTDAFTAEFFYANPYLLGPVTVPNLIIANCEYWTIDRTSGASTVDVILSWSSIGGCNPAIFTLNVNELVGAHFNGSSWNLTGGMGAGTVPAGEVTWSGYSAFNAGSNPFVIGTLSPLQIPLDVRLTDVRVYKNGNGNQVEWTNLTESNVRSYVVERSADGRHFTAIGGKLPAVNNGSRASYSFNDAAPFDAVTYYRILITEMDGRMSYSKIVKVQPDGLLTSGFSVYPNPAKDGQVSLTMSGMQKGQYQLIITNAIGQSVYTKTINYRGGSMTEVLNFPATVGKGLYNMVISNTGFRKATSLVIQ